MAGLVHSTNSCVAMEIGNRLNPPIAIGSKIGYTLEVQDWIPGKPWICRFSGLHQTPKQKEAAAKVISSEQGYSPVESGNHRTMLWTYGGFSQLFSLITGESIEMWQDTNTIGTCSENLHVKHNKHPAVLEMMGVCYERSGPLSQESMVNRLWSIIWQSKSTNLMVGHHLLHENDDEP